jgi:hypothetical protein
VYKRYANVLYLRIDEMLILCKNADIHTYMLFTSWEVRTGKYFVEAEARGTFLRQRQIFSRTDQPKR